MDSPWSAPAVKFEDLRSFLTALEILEDLKRIDVPVCPVLEITEICHRTLTDEGPALLFTQPKGSQVSVLANLFGTKERIAAALGITEPEGFKQLGGLLAALKPPSPPRGLGDAHPRQTLAPRDPLGPPWALIFGGAYKRFEHLGPSRGQNAQNAYTPPQN